MTVCPTKTAAIAIGLAFLSFACSSGLGVDAGGDRTALEGESPEGMALDPQTGELTWTPDDSQVGEHTVLVTATDGTTSETARATVRVSAVRELVSGTIGPAGEMLEVTDQTSEIWAERDRKLEQARDDRALRPGVEI